MNKRCARCDKTVYPIEELKCLDKIWHKQCFKCQSCGMTLNMRNYKGFNKDPYCEAHIPKAKATSVAETPELKRIAENTKIQSNAKYHADFEKNKGKLTQVADDPETLRIKQNSQIISNVAYHGDLKKKAEMEWKRTLNGENGQAEEPRKNTNHTSVPHYDPVPPNNVPNSHHVKVVESQKTTNNSPYSARQSSTLIYSSHKGPLNTTAARSVGSIADIDPVNNFYGSLTDHQHQQQQQMQHIQQNKQIQHMQHMQQNHQQMQQMHPNHQQMQQMQQNHQQMQQMQQNHQQMQQMQQNHQQMQQMQQNHQKMQHMQQNHQMQYNSQRIPPPKQEMNKSGNIYRAMYDYDARESDEISFLDGDIILNCVHIHDGWMSGVVQRTGQTGLLPANYVESIII